ncbi:sensor histidine kinase [Pseudonocardia lacus]|uniref:sensor histidine kinase n=1 Tax=Pseudonocardia lacus TaxID=2835865 RepID=UPI001BDC1B32|nr:ATP-binding protein [Pseudonocardia lacus]
MGSFASGFWLPRGVGGRLRLLANDSDILAGRQLGILAVYLLAHLMFLVPGVGVTDGQAWVVGLAAALMAGATATAFVLRLPGMPVRAVMVIPLLDLVAIGFLRAGTGGAGSVFAALLILPVLLLGVQPGMLPLFIGTPLIVGVVFLPQLFDPTSMADGQWIRAIFTPLILVISALWIHGLKHRLNSRVEAVQVLRRKQEELLAEAQDNATASIAASNLIQESAHQMAGVLDAVTEQSIIGTDLCGRIDVFNTGAQKMLGVAAHEVVGRRNVVDFHLPDELSRRAGEDPGDTRSPLTAPVGDGDADVQDWTYRRADGSTLRVRVAITARHDAAGDVEGYLYVATDVTEERRQARSKDEFVNLISHELRTPLSSILGYLELISDDDEHPLTAEQTTYLATIERNAQRLLRLVSDLLFTAQVESGRFALQESDVDLGTVVSASLEAARPVATARDVSVVLSRPATAPHVWGDATRLGQAVDNLVSNAIKFTPPGGRVAITLSTTAGDDPEREMALISVSDTGIGIPADEIDRLFSRFFRASTAVQFAVPGVGLGLTITQAIAVAHHGTIRVASTVGEGTTFALALPLTPVDDPVEAPPPADGVRAGGLPSRG